MKIGWVAFRTCLAFAWLVVLAVTFHASNVAGPNGWIPALAAEIHQPWPAQFDVDFTVHLLLMATWIVFRARTWTWGLVWGCLALVGGSLFSLAYLLVLTFQVKGDWRRLLLGRHT